MRSADGGHGGAAVAAAGPPTATGAGVWVDAGWPVSRLRTAAM